MLRTLETCYFLFKDHENPPPIFVNPLITEWLHVNHDAPLFPNNYQQLFPHFNWSLMPQTYFVPEILKNKYTQMISPENDFLKGPALQ